MINHFKKLDFAARRASHCSASFRAAHGQPAYAYRTLPAPPWANLQPSFGRWISTATDCWQRWNRQRHHRQTMLEAVKIASAAHFSRCICGQKRTSPTKASDRPAMCAAGVGFVRMRQSKSVADSPVDHIHCGTIRITWPPRATDHFNKLNSAAHVHPLVL